MAEDALIELKDGQKIPFSALKEGEVFRKVDEGPWFLVKVGPYITRPEETGEDVWTVQVEDDCAE